LCRDDRELIDDVAFALAPGGTGQVAVHCKECKGRNHLRTDLPLGLQADD
jgi:hypothetical protein